jgi:hypothetical protein
VPQHAVRLAQVGWLWEQRELVLVPGRQEVIYDIIGAAFIMEIVCKSPLMAGTGNSVWIIIGLTAPPRL